MILNREILSMPEVQEHLDKKNEPQAELITFIKKFNTLNAKDASSLRKKILGLEILKIRDEHMAKIIDLLPETPEDLNKIFVGVGLDEDENKRILDEIKQVK